ncbi:sugar-phosphatase [Liquorilactobacillus vini]|uniref:sugar-phosphatase n=1 Tax=Liquorilactobacillus vini TaxID=238015 RepID=UPI00054D0C16
MSIKLVAIDVDGTLLNSSKEVTVPVIKAIHQAKKQGVKIVICTGRPLSGVKDLLKQLGLDDQSDQFVVSFGGAMVQKTNGEILSEQPISYDSYLQLELLARQKQLHFHAISHDRIYTADRDIGHYTVYESLIAKLEISYRTPAELRQTRLIKAMFIDDPQRLTQAMTDWEPFRQLEDQVAFTKSSPFYLEANARGVNKGHALQLLARKLQLTENEIMAIGDEGNDLSMIIYAGLGVAMGNAIPKVKAAANWQTADNDHDGVAVALNNYVINN